VSVLVAGGAGYIGSHAVKALRAAGEDIVVYDDLSAGHRQATRLLHAPLETGDIRDTARLTAIMRAHEVTAVMHFAALLSVADSVTDPGRYYDVNVGGTVSVLRAMSS
jgi:UDP-glucose 4-epimerase